MDGMTNTRRHGQVIGQLYSNKEQKLHALEEDGNSAIRNTFNIIPSLDRGRFRDGMCNPVGRHKPCISGTYEEALRTELVPLTSHGLRLIGGSVVQP